MGRRRRRRETPLSLTFVVAAVDSRDPYAADYRCNGVADEVEINLALAALGVAEGVVVLMEGTFTLAASIAYTTNNQTLRGQGRSTYIDGTALGAGVHAIINSGFDDCELWSLAVETNAGGGLATDCVFVEDGANDMTIAEVTIVNSDRDGIHFEGTTIFQGHVHHNHIEAADENGIHVVMDAVNTMNRLHVEDNDVVNCGGNGINFATSGGNEYCQIVNNIVYNATVDGIVLWDGDHSLVRGNLCLTLGAEGIVIRDTEDAQILGNVIVGATANGLMTSGSINLAIMGNMIQGAGQPGLYLVGVTGSTVVGNTIRGSQMGIFMYSGANNNTITGNTCQGNTQDGIKLYGALGNTITGNTCYGNVYNGIFLDSSSHDNTIVGNTCIGNDSGDTGNYDGIKIDTCNRVLIVGNTCQDQEGWGILLGNNSDYCKVSNNYTALNVAGSINVNGATCDGNEVVFNTVEEGAPVDTGTLTRASGNFDPSANAYIAPIGAAPF